MGEAKPKIEIVEFKREELDALLERVRAFLPEVDCEVVEKALLSYSYLLAEIEQGKLSLKRLRDIIFGPKTEKLEKALNNNRANSGSGESTGQSKEKPKGHGRNGRDAYPGAEKITVEHETLSAGDECPECEKGKVYPNIKPGILMRFSGQAPVRAAMYVLEKLRCNLCGAIFTAKVPEEAKKEKYAETVGSIIGIHKYGSGTPFNRIDKLQKNVGVPLPSSTQWEILLRSYKLISPVSDELARQGACGHLLYNDDTGAQILELSGKRLEKLIANGEHSGKRTGVYTSGIVSENNGRKIALFFTGNRHAGENLAGVLKQRNPELPPPIQMCDALSRNIPKDFETVLANCNCHARRNFFAVRNSFPQECEYVLNVFSRIYKNDAQAKKLNLSPGERLIFHQEKSKPPMDDFEKWLHEQIKEKKVEPNSSLGDAIRYMLDHWKALTQFLHVVGAPLDNNVTERALKKAILHRKNSLFYKSLLGARVGDAFMSLIHTAELNGANAFDYLNELQRNPAELAQNPADWMPWNYRKTLAARAAWQPAPSDSS